MEKTITGAVVNTRDMQSSEILIPPSLLKPERSARSQAARSKPFIASVISIAADRSIAKVRICTGATMDVPLSILANIEHIGSVEFGDGSLELASARFDISTPIGMLVQRMALEVDRLAGALAVAQKRLDRSSSEGLR